MSSIHAGWYLVAFTDVLQDDLTPIRIGDRRLMVVRDNASEQGYVVADSSCPHRGADLTAGGELRDGCVACPFHGRLISVGEHPRRLSVATYPTYVAGPLIFARLAHDPLGDNGFVETMDRLTQDKRIVTAVDRVVNVPVDFVVENAFDTEHFPTVHKVPSLAGMHTERRPEGTLIIGGDFLTVGDPWYDLRYARALQSYLQVGARDANRRSAFRATAFSPTVVLTAFGSGADDPIILTGALPTPDGTLVRVAVIGTSSHPLERIAEASRLAINQDTVVWESIDPASAWTLDEQDANIVAYRDWVADFPLAQRNRPTRVVS